MITPAMTRGVAEGRRLVLLVELEQLSEADLLELSDFLNGLLAPPDVDPERIKRACAVSVYMAEGSADLHDRQGPVL